MAYMAIRAIDLIAKIILLLLASRAVTSWFLAGGSPRVYRFYDWTCRWTDPLVRPFRRFCFRFNTGMFDFSVLIAFLVVSLTRTVLIRILAAFLYGI